MTEMLLTGIPNFDLTNEQAGRNHHKKVRHTMIKHAIWLAKYFDWTAQMYCWSESLITICHEARLGHDLNTQTG